MRLAERLYRTSRTGLLAAQVYLSYKVPRMVDRARRADHKRRNLSPVHERNANKIFRTAVELRGLMIKLAQVIGTRSDVFPPEYIRILSKCHDAVPPRAFAEIAPVIEQDLGAPVERLFDSVEQRPIAAASLAQVHRARLRDGGATVAVKVQYPDIAEIVRTDIANMTRVCAIYERLDPQPMELMPLLQEMQTHLALELDFQREIRSAERIAELFKGDPAVTVPRVYHELSAGRVITMEFHSGIKPTDKDALVAAGLDTGAVVQELMRVYVTMILARGFFQADPHPGNIFVNPYRRRDGKVIPRFVLLDFGLAKELPKSFGYALFNLMFAIMTRNDASAIKSFKELGFETKSGDPSTLLMVAHALNRRAPGQRFEGEFNREITEELFKTIRENPVIRVPSDFVLVGRCFELLSGIAHTLGARANVLTAMAPPAYDPTEAA